MKSISLLTLLLLGTFYSSAQSEIGVNGGFATAGLEGNLQQCEFPHSIETFYGGVFFAMKLSRSFYIQPEVNFSQQGGKQVGLQHVPGTLITEAKFHDGDFYADVEKTTKFNYIEIPLLAKFVFGRKLGYYGSFGPYVAFCTSATTQIEGYTRLYLNSLGTIPYMENDVVYSPVSLSRKINSTRNVNRLNAGLQGGVGLQYHLPHGNIILEYRTTMGITKIRSHPKIEGQNQTNSLAVTIGYSFELK